jgi:hypothetical protein
VAVSITQLISKKDSTAEDSPTNDGEPQLSPEEKEFRDYLHSLFKVYIKYYII